MTILGTFSFCLGPPRRGDLKDYSAEFIARRKKEGNERRDDKGEPPLVPKRQGISNRRGRFLLVLATSFTKGQTSCKP